MLTVTSAFAGMTNFNTHRHPSAALRHSWNDVSGRRNRGSTKGQAAPALSAPGPPGPEFPRPFSRARSAALRRIPAQRADGGLEGCGGGGAAIDGFAGDHLDVGAEAARHAHAAEA